MCVRGEIRTLEVARVSDSVFAAFDPPAFGFYCDAFIMAFFC
jgi:hypothetical protein